MRDFSLDIYKKLLLTLSEAGYEFKTFEQFVSENVNNKVVILRHDVDRAPKNAVKMAKIENELDIRASYYYRIVNESFNEKSINTIVKLGHELGYHYEDLALAKGKTENAIKEFEKNLNTFKKFYPVKTMCMHGSPMSKWDNRLIWQQFDYKDFGIIAEPYFDIDFNKLFYITDASRAWNNEEVTLRDKVDTNYNYQINSTLDIIKMLENGNFPNELMISTHPHNWADSYIEWIKIYIWQTIKNQVKKYLVKKS
ncbi:MAG: hypothetical protein JXR51_14975 [Bacteroidales bacterium]|nr:hypothetical protein [Bacteroidales bacterium]MBN2758474.1 hypothetical protein [Bacteroidales bacterium]